MAATARVGKSGQVTIPVEIRKRLGLKPGDTVIWGTGPRGEMTVTPVRYAFEDVCGIVPALETEKNLMTIIDESLEEWGEAKVHEYEDLGIAIQLEA